MNTARAKPEIAKKQLTPVIAARKKSLKVQEQGVSGGENIL